MSDVMEIFSVMDNNPEFAEYRLECTDCRDVRFTGKLLGTAEGRTIIWQRMSLYITLAGNYVAFNEWVPLELSKLNSTARVCSTQEEIFKFFGCCGVAKDLYRKSGLEDTVDVP